MNSYDRVCEIVQAINRIGRPSTNLVGVWAGKHPRGRSLVEELHRTVHKLQDVLDFTGLAKRACEDLLRELEAEQGKGGE